MRARKGKRHSAWDSFAVALCLGHQWLGCFHLKARSPRLLRPSYRRFEDQNAVDGFAQHRNAAASPKRFEAFRAERRIQRRTDAVVQRPIDREAIGMSALTCSIDVSKQNRRATRFR